MFLDPHNMLNFRWRQFFVRVRPGGALRLAARGAARRACVPVVLHLVGMWGTVFGSVGAFFVLMGIAASGGVRPAGGVDFLGPRVGNGVDSVLGHVYTAVVTPQRVVCDISVPGLPPRNPVSLDYA